jgi:uroporphyrinogen-III synthase
MNTLKGINILITAQNDGSKKLRPALLALGANVFVVSMINIVPFYDSLELQKAKAAISFYTWLVFTSQNGVKSFFLKPVNVKAIKVAAIGRATALTLEKKGIEVAFTGSAKGAAFLAEEMNEKFSLKGEKILYPCSNLADNDFLITAQSRGAQVTMIKTYEVQPSLSVDKNLLKKAEVVIFYSPSAVRAFTALVSLKGKTAVAIGEKTAVAVKNKQPAFMVTAKGRTVKDMMDAVKYAAGVYGE